MSTYIFFERKPHTSVHPLLQNSTKKAHKPYKTDPKQFTNWEQTVHKLCTNCTKTEHKFVHQDCKAEPTPEGVLSHQEYMAVYVILIIEPLMTTPGDLVVPDPFERVFCWYSPILDQVEPFCIFLPVYFNPSIWTRLFWSVYLDLYILTCLCWTIYFDQSIWTHLLGPVCLDISVWTCLFGPVFLDPSFKTNVFGLLC